MMKFTIEPTGSEYPATYLEYVREAGTVCLIQANENPAHPDVVVLDGQMLETFLDILDEIKSPVKTSVATGHYDDE